MAYQHCGVEGDISDMEKEVEKAYTEREDAIEEVARCYRRGG